MTSPKDRDPYVALARLSMDTYVSKGHLATLPDDLPKEMLQTRAGAFVSLHIDGNLRGCIGTIGPTQPNLAEEILHNAVSAAVNDPRFPPVLAKELPAIEVKVDVLGQPEPIEDESFLDPKVYGVIVSSGHRRGLLLPDLEGVDTVRQQVDIARQKAGIPPHTPLQLERFKVTRHE